MDRQIPKCSKILSKLERENVDEILVKKLTSIQGRKNNYFRKEVQGRPDYCAKKQQLKLIRQQQINLENRVLAQKMIQIENQNMLKQQQLKRIKNQSAAKLSSIVNNNSSYGEGSVPKKSEQSLNKHQRKQEILRITMANLNLMGRIQQIKSSVSSQSEVRIYKHQKMLNMISEYPVIIEKRVQTPSEIVSQRQNQLRRGRLDPMQSTQGFGVTGFSQKRQLMDDLSTVIADRDMRSRTAQGFNLQKSQEKLDNHEAHQTHSAAFFSRNQSVSKTQKPKIKYPIIMHEQLLDYLKTQYSYKISQISRQNYQAHSNPQEQGVHRNFKPGRRFPTQLHSLHAGLQAEPILAILTFADKKKLDSYDSNTDLLIIFIIKEVKDIQRKVELQKAKELGQQRVNNYPHIKSKVFDPKPKISDNTTNERDEEIQKRLKDRHLSLQAKAKLKALPRFGNRIKDLNSLSFQGSNLSGQGAGHQITETFSTKNLNIEVESVADLRKSSKLPAHGQEADDIIRVSSEDEDWGDSKSQNKEEPSEFQQRDQQINFRKSSESSHHASADQKVEIKSRADSKKDEQLNYQIDEWDFKEEFSNKEEETPKLQNNSAPPIDKNPPEKNLYDPGIDPKSQQAIPTQQKDLQLGNEQKTPSMTINSSKNTPAQIIRNSSSDKTPRIEKKNSLHLVKDPSTIVEQKKQQSLSKIQEQKPQLTQIITENSFERKITPSQPAKPNLTEIQRLSQATSSKQSSRLDNPQSSEDLSSKSGSRSQKKSNSSQQISESQSDSSDFEPKSSANSESKSLQEETEKKFSSGQEPSPMKIASEKQNSSKNLNNSNTEKIMHTSVKSSIQSSVVMQKQQSNFFKPNTNNTQRQVSDLPNLVQDSDEDITAQANNFSQFDNFEHSGGSDEDDVDVSGMPYRKKGRDRYDSDNDEFQISNRKPILNPEQQFSQVSNFKNYLTKKPKKLTFFQGLIREVLG